MIGDDAAGPLTADGTYVYMRVNASAGRQLQQLDADGMAAV